MTQRHPPNKTQRRIGIIIPEFPGITHDFFWREIVSLQQRGAEIRVISTRRPEPVLHVWQSQSDRITRYSLPTTVASMFSGFLWASLKSGRRFARAAGLAIFTNGRTLTERANAVAALLLAISLFRWASRQKLDHLHSHSAGNCAYIALFLAALLGIDYSITLHSSYSAFGGDQNLKWKHARFGIAVSDFVLRELRAAVPNARALRFIVAPMGVDTDKFRRSRPYEIFQPGKQLRLVSCGRLHFGKAHDDSIRTVSILRSRGWLASLEILGEGPHRAELERLIAELALQSSVRLLGAVSAEQVVIHYLNAHVFLSASVDEAIGVAIMEAMALELPIVATTVGGVPELVRDGIDGLLVPPRSPSAMADAVEQLALDPARCESMGRCGRERIASSFSKERSADALLQALEPTM